MQIVLSHGSGSFGHTYAARYGIHRGIAPDADWMGFALTAGAALRLNRIVVDELLAAGVPALSLQPSTTLRSSGGQLVAWDSSTVGRALDRRLVPVIHGDVAFDDAQGSAIISTEQLLVYLAQQAGGLRPTRVILVGESASTPPTRAPTRRRSASHGSARRILRRCWRGPAARTART